MAYSASSGIYSSTYPPLPSLPVKPTWSILLDDHPYSNVAQSSGKGAGGKKDQIALRDCHSGKAYTFEELRHITLRLGAGLLKGAGLKRGDVVFISIIPNIDCAIIYLACQAAGLIVSPSNPLYTPKELAHVLSLVQPAVAIIPPQALPLFEKVMGDAKERKLRLMLAAGDPLSKDTWPSTGGSVIWALQSLVDEDDKSLRKLLSAEGGLSTSKEMMDSTNGLFFSSGTSGLPKAVVLTHRNTWEQVKALLSAPGLTSLSPMGKDGSDRAARAVSQAENHALTLPLFHIGGCLGMWATLARGDTGHILSPFNLELLFKTAEAQNITRIAMVPPILLALIRSPLFAKYSLRTVQKAATGAAPLGPDLQREASKALNCNVTQVWGMSETTGVATHASPFESPALGSCGKPLPGVEIRIVMEHEKGDGQVTYENMPPGKEGEIWIRGGTITQGYLNNKEANEESFVFDEEYAKGPNGKLHWFKTGDIGYIRPDGHMYIVDRRKELLKYKGFQIAPAELEDIVLGHPAVLDAGVIGIYDDSQATELPRAYVVKRPDINTSDQQLEKDIQEHVAKHVVQYKKLRGGVRFIEVIPKGPSGKILRRELREMAKKELGEAKQPQSKL